MAYLYELHCHTSETSICGKVSGAEHARYYKALGYDGICITDHFLNGNAIRYPDLPWPEQIDRFEEGYLSAKREGDRIGLKVFFGWENSLSHGTHVLTYGLDADFLRAHPEVLTLPFREYAALIREHGGTLIQAHPFRLASYVTMIQVHPSYVDAVETDNSGNDDRANLLAAFYAEQYGLPIAAGSDNHTDTRERYAAVFSPVELRTVDELMRAILDRKTENVSVYAPKPL